MKYVNGLWWPDSETALLGHGISYQDDVRDKAIALIPEDRRNCAIDVGAHVGIASLHLAKHFKLVVAFEPVNEHYECLGSNLLDVENVLTCNFGLSDHNHGLEFISNKGNTGYTVPFAVRDDGESFAIPLDSLNLKPQLIKIDVEGFEPLVIKGAERTISTYTPVIIIEVKGLGYSKNNPFEPIELLQSWGYKIHDKVSNDYIMTAGNYV